MGRPNFGVIGAGLRQARYKGFTPRHISAIILEDKAPLVSGESGKKSRETSLAAQGSVKGTKLINSPRGE
ncbi:MAG: hypothetical protein AMS15_07490 [Planctomycetes bacterium DG_23]|nr:MAG: hypothetical protein AMS15_07490 [Planctomycetes bacterium DG_23]